MVGRRWIIALAALAACGGGATLATGGGGGDHGGCPPADAKGGYETTTTTECPTPGTLPAKIDICHKTGNGFMVISISSSALPAHLAHGDIYPVPPEGCEAHETTTTHKPPHETTTTTKYTTSTVGNTTTTIKTTTTTGGGGTTTVVQTTTTTTGGGGTTTTSSSVTTSTSTTGPPTPGGPTTTPTTTPGATTTLPATFQFAGAATVCRAEVPTIVIDFTSPGFPSLAGHVGILTMSDINGNVVTTQELVYRPGAHYELLYPGTRVNPDGSIADVPGWNLTNAGLWVRDPSDAFLREGINLSFTVNPTATAFVTYPPESSACANPENPPIPPRVVPPTAKPPTTSPPGNGLPPTL